MSRLHSGRLTHGSACYLHFVVIAPKLLCSLVQEAFVDQGLPRCEEDFAIVRCLQQALQPASIFRPLGDADARDVDEFRDIAQCHASGKDDRMACCKKPNDNDGYMFDFINDRSFRLVRTNVSLHIATPCREYACGNECCKFLGCFTIGLENSDGKFWSLECMMSRLWL